MSATAVLAPPSPARDPRTTVPRTTVLRTTVPRTTVPRTTVPRTTVPRTTVPRTTVLRTTVARARAHLLVPAALAGGLFLWDPARHGGPPLCPFRALTGHSCPGCGLTRAAGAFLRGRWSEAFTLHPLAPLLILQVAMACLAFVVFGPKLSARVATRSLTALLVVNAVALIAVWAVRSSTGQISVLG